MREHILRNWKSGLVTKIEDYSIPEDAASRSLNWLTLGDKIELSGGYSIIGTENGAGKITGLAVGEKVDGTLFPIRTRGQKVEYYSGSDWTEAGSSVLGADADGEDTSITFYTSLAGYQAWISSPNSGLFKMMLANPGSIEDQYAAATNFKGYITASDGRLLLWYRDRARNYLYGSYKDVQTAGTTFTNVSAEAIGSSGLTNYTGTLAAVTGKRTCFSVVFTDGTQTAQDDKNGNFIGDATGTINYTTGAYDITFGSTTTGSVTADYSWEDSATAGLANFTFSATRTATQGFFLPQPTGGDLLNVLPYRTEKYCLHENNAWLFSLPVDDLNPTNQEFRLNMGLSAPRAAVATGDGIYFIDTSNPEQPRFKLLTLESTSDQVIPQEFSFNVDLSGYDFTTGVAFRWGDYILFAGKTSGASVNNRLFAFHKEYKCFDVLDYQVSCMADYGGQLWAGEPSTDNVTRLFTGHTANGSNIINYWEGKLTKLQVDELKKFKRLTLRGEIGPTQSLTVSLAYDGGAFASVGTIDGDGSYVASGSGHSIGEEEVGASEIGGGGDGVTKNLYVREFRTRSGKFDEVKIRIEATSVGYASVSEINFYDIRTYGQKNLTRYRATA